MPASSLLVANGNPIVVDCGLGVARGIVDQGFALPRLDHIFITHLHSDHFLELGPLLHTAWTAGLDHDVQIYGPKGTEEYLSAFFQSMRFDIETRINDEGRPDLREMVGLSRIGNEPVDLGGGLLVTGMLNHHPPVSESYALKFEWQDKKVIFSGDTAFMPGLAEFAADADLLVHEAMLADGIQRLVERLPNKGDRLRKHLYASHSTAEEAGKVAALAAVKALAINHKVPADDPLFNDADWEKAVRRTWSGRLYIGRDGTRIDI